MVAIELSMAQVIIGTDNGFIIQRRGPNDYVVGYADPYTSLVTHEKDGAHHYRSLQFEQMNINFNNRNIMFGQAEDEFSTGISAFNGVVYTTDRGHTWQPRDPSGSSNPPLQTSMNNKALFGLVSELFLVDEDGVIWSQAASGLGAFVKSIDQGLTFVGVWPSVTAGSTLVSKWAKGPYLWEFPMSYGGSPPTNPNLNRRDKVAGTVVSTVLTGVPTASMASLGTGITGTFVGNTLAIFRNGLSNAPLTIVDITDPNAPTWTYYADPFHGEFQMIVQPTEDDNVLLALTEGGSPFGGVGTLRRSTDKGATWTIVIGPTTNIGIGLIPTGYSGAGNVDGGVEEDCHRIAVSGTHCWVCTKPPYVYHSADNGATWTLELIDMTIFNPYTTTTNAINPTHCLSIDAYGFDVVLAAEARLDSGGNRVWFNQSF